MTQATATGGAPRMAIPAIALLTSTVVACSGPPDTGFADTEQARVNGRRLYLANCVPCHGERADGNGPQRGGLQPPPRDYTDRSWRESTTPGEVFTAISEGVKGSAMPSWNRILSRREIWDLTAYVLSVAEQGFRVAGEGAPAPPASAR